LLSVVPSPKSHAYWLIVPVDWLTKLIVNGAGPWFGTALKPATGAGMVGTGDDGTAVFVGMGCVGTAVGGIGVKVRVGPGAGLTTTTACTWLCPPGPLAIRVTVYVPGCAKAWVGLGCVLTVPSPKFHIYWLIVPVD